MANGKVDIRMNEKTGKVRMRFHGVAPDQHEVIRHALDLVKKEIGTEYDTVALEHLAIHFLSFSDPSAAAV